MIYEEDELVERVVQRIIRQLFNGMPVPELEPGEYVLALEVGRGFTNEQIAERLDCPYSTVANRISTLLKRLQIKRPMLMGLGFALRLKLEMEPEVAERHEERFREPEHVFDNN